MAGRDRKRRWRRNCRRRYDRVEHSDSWVVNPTCRTQSSLFFMSCMNFDVCFQGVEAPKRVGAWEIPVGRVETYIVRIDSTMGMNPFVTRAGG